MTKERILFVCIHNSARSQMAEAFMNAYCPDECEAESAGLTPGVMNPMVVEAMLEVGFDLSAKPTRDVFDVWKSGRLFSRVITVCDEASAERCPIFPGAVTRDHWSFPDPSQFAGTYGERLELTRQVRDAIKAKVEAWCSVHCRTAAMTVRSE